MSDSSHPPVVPDPSRISPAPATGPGSSDAHEFSERLSLPVELVESGDRGKHWRVVVLKSGFGLNRGSSGRNPRYYPAEVLPKLAELLEGCPIHFRGDDAPTHEDRPAGWKPGDNRPTPDGTRVGFLRNVRVEVVEGVPSTVGDMHLTDVGDRVRSRLAGAWDRTKRALELSINATGVEERFADIKGKIADAVRDFTSVASTELVRFGAAGGRLVELVAAEDNEMKAAILRALRKAPLPTDALANLDELDEDALVAFAREHFTGAKYHALLDSLAPTAESDNAHKIALAHKLHGAVAAIDANDTETAEGLFGKVADAEPPVVAAEPAAPAVDPVKAAEEKALADRARADLEKQIADLQAQAAAKDAELAKRDTAARVAEAVKAADLPDEMKAEFVESFEGRVAADSDINAALTKKVKRFESMARRGEVKGMTTAATRVEFVEGADEVTKISAAFYNALGVNAEIAESFLGIPKDVSRSAGRMGLLKSFQTWTGIENPMAFGTRMNPAKMPAALASLAKMSSWERAELAEDLQTSDWTNVLANGINAVLIGAYRDTPRGEKMLLSESEVTDNLQPQSRRRIGGFGLLPPRAEAAAYTVATNPGNEKVEWTPVDRGLQIEVTLETILKDQVGAVRAMSRELGIAAYKTESQVICDELLSGDGAGSINDTAIYDSVVLYHTGSHGNLGSTALSSDSLEAAYNRMALQVHAGTSGGGVVVPKFLVVPPQLRRTALKLVGSSQEPENGTNAINVFQGDLTVIVSHFLRGDAKNWYLVADPSLNDTIAMTYLNSMEPQVLVQDDPLADTVLKNRKYTHVVSFWMAPKLQDYRSFDGSIVA